MGWTYGVFHGGLECRVDESWCEQRVKRDTKEV